MTPDGSRLLSPRLYRILLRAYPRDFRRRFGAELEADFARMLAARGHRFAWTRVLRDITQALWLTHTHARATRAREARLMACTRLPIASGESPMSSLVFDTRQALRALARAPMFTAVTVLTLALGIGANSAVFSLVNAVLLRPLGYREPSRLMLVHEAIPESKVPRFAVSPPDYLDLVEYQRSFEAIGAYRTRALELSGAGMPEQVTSASVSSSIFPMLGVKPARGRVFTPEEDRREQGVAMVSTPLARRRFGDRDPIGQQIVLDRRPYTIVGIMPPSFEFPRRGPQFNGQPADVWLPLVFNPFERQARGMMYSLSVLGRLRDGMPADRATADVGALASRIRDNYPAEIRNAPFTLRVLATPLLDEIAGQVRRPLLVMLGAVGLVLLVACANVGNLVLSRAVGRQRELSVRTALGAGRFRLFQMLLTESLLLAGLGGAIGLLIGRSAVRAMPRVIASSLPAVGEVTLDVRVVSFTVAVSLLTAVFFGVVPLMAGAPRDVNELLREGGARAVGGRRQHRVRSTLVVTSIAFAFVLLVAAGLLVRSFVRLIAIESGVRTANVLTLDVTLPHAGYNDAARVRRFYRSLHARLAAIPGVRSAAIASDLPLKSEGGRRAFSPESMPPGTGLPPAVAVTWLHGDYFRTFGIPLLRGRLFTSDEVGVNRRVAIVSRALAERIWPGEEATGKRFKWGLPDSPDPWQTVVGIAGDVVSRPLGSEPVIHIYLPYAEISDTELAESRGGLRLTLALNTSVDAAALAGEARAAVAAEDPALAVSNVATLEQVASDASAPQRFSAIVLATFATGALLLAAIGLYGVLAFGVSQRTREIGVRLALGASRVTLLRQFVREGMMLALAGVIIGCVGSLAAVRVLRVMLFETHARDPWTFVAVPTVLLLVALAASYLPARRAANVDPMTALRAD